MGLGLGFTLEVLKSKDYCKALLGLVSGSTSLSMAVSRVRVPGWLYEGVFKHWDLASFFEPSFPPARERSWNAMMAEGLEGRAEGIHHHHHLASSFRTQDVHQLWLLAGKGFLRGNAIQFFLQDSQTQRVSM